MKKAFTLAETLITLGIIGVVASLTLPSLIAEHQKNVLKKQFIKSYSTIYQAAMMLPNNLGYVPQCHYPDDSSDGNDVRTECNLFFEELAKNAKIGKKCSGNARSSGCIPKYKGEEKIIGDRDDMSDEEKDFSSRNCGAFTTNQFDRLTAWHIADGTIIMHNNNAVNFLVDINGFRGPNKWGYDIFEFAFFGNSKDEKILLRPLAYGCAVNRIEKGGMSSVEMWKSVFK